MRSARARWRGRCRVALSVVSLSAALGCAPEFEIVTGCAAARGIEPICGFQNPEDLVLLEDGRTVVVSQMGSMDGARTGNLAVFDLGSEELRIAYPPAQTPAAGDAPKAASGWGDPDCPGPPGAALSPHGLDRATRADGRRELLVVNHGGRESVEFFELVGAGPGLAVEWRGCVVAPETGFFNDVVALPDVGGGFLVTHMMDRDSQVLATLQGVFGGETGFVYEWRPGTGFRPVPGTEGSLPNGIELTPDGRDVILNLYLGDEVRRIARDTGELRASAKVARPDNVTWSSDGRLLVASHSGARLVDQLACQDLTEGSCPFGFEIVSLDPETLKGGPVFANGGAPMGAGTVAIDVGGDLLIGSFSGDRVIRVQPQPIDLD